MLLLSQIEYLAKYYPIFGKSPDTEEIQPRVRPAHAVGLTTSLNARVRQ